MAAWGVEARVPFLDLEFLGLAMSIDAEHKRVRAGDPVAQAQVWQRHYFAGKTLKGEAVGGHIHKRRLSAPRPAGADD